MAKTTAQQTIRLSAEANGEGLSAAIGLSRAHRWWKLGVRASWRNIWVGLRLTHFPSPHFVHVITFQPLPCLAIQFLWRNKALISPQARLKATLKDICDDLKE